MRRGVVHIKGLREVQDALRQLPRATGKAAMRKVLREGGEPIARAARGFVPKDTYALHESIDVSPKLSRSQLRAIRGAARSTVVMYVGPGPYPQAVTQEFGTFKDPAQPFMRPAWDAEKMNTLGIVRDSLWGEIDAAVSRSARRAARLAAKG